MRLLLVLILIAAAGISQAEAANVLALGEGVDPCAKWLSSPPNDLAGASWVEGYWTGLNVANRTNHAVGSSMQSIDIVKLMEARCLMEPNTLLAKLVDEVYAELAAGNR